MEERHKLGKRKKRRGGQIPKQKQQNASGN
jgi:hypothetical protein